MIAKDERKKINVSTYYIRGPLWLSPLNGIKWRTSCESFRKQWTTRRRVFSHSCHWFSASLLQVILPIFIFRSLSSPTYPPTPYWLTYNAVKSRGDPFIGEPLASFVQESWQSYYSTASSSIQNNYSCHLVCLSRTVALWSRRTKKTAQSVKSGWNRRISQSTILWIPTDLWIIADIFPKFKYNVKNEEKDRWRLWAYYPDSRKRFYPSSNFLENLHENSYETLSRRL